MRDFLKSIVKFIIELFENFPILTGILVLLILIYSIKYALPKAYKSDKQNLYSYYNRLGLVMFSIFFCSTIFVIQLFRFFN